MTPKFAVEAHVRPRRINGDMITVGDNSKLCIRSSQDDCVEIQFENGDRIAVDAANLIDAVKRCS